jgi:hypothetical protein
MPKLMQEPTTDKLTDKPIGGKPAPPCASILMAKFAPKNVTQRSSIVLAKMPCEMWNLADSAAT